jgi:hypothetical protein
LQKTISGLNLLCAVIFLENPAYYKRSQRKERACRQSHNAARGVLDYFEILVLQAAGKMATHATKIPDSKGAGNAS